QTLERLGALDQEVLGHLRLALGQPREAGQDVGHLLLTEHLEEKMGEVCRIVHAIVVHGAVRSSVGTGHAGAERGACDGQDLTVKAVAESVDGTTKDVPDGRPARVEISEYSLTRAVDGEPFRVAGSA